MSETVHYRGRATVIPKQGKETGLQQAERICKEKEIDILSYHDDAIEALLDYSDPNDRGFKQMYFYNSDTDTWYDLDYKRLDYADDVFIVQETPIKDQYSFELRYYNGGCGFNEALEEGFENLFNRPNQSL